jgi:hypothetical protein
MSGEGSGRLGASEYAELVSGVQSAISTTLAPGASVLVLSKGDAALVEIPGIAAAHFPQDARGAYAGHHPSDGESATAQLEELRRRGAQYLVIPATARWWLEHYGAFANHLAAHARLICDVPGACLIFDLGQPVAESHDMTTVAVPRTSSEQMRDYLEKLVSTDSTVVVLEAGDAGLASSLAPVRASALATAGLHGEDEGAEAGLARLAAEGAEYLVIPRTSDEWLDAHAELAAGIEGSCRKIADQRHLCRVFELRGLRSA